MVLGNVIAARIMFTGSVIFEEGQDRCTVRTKHLVFGSERLWFQLNVNNIVSCVTTIFPNLNQVLCVPDCDLKKSNNALVAIDIVENK